MTRWMDPAAKSLLKSSSRGRFDMTMAFLGVPHAPGRVGFEGSFTQDLVQRYARNYDVLGGLLDDHVAIPTSGPNTAEALA